MDWQPIKTGPYQKVIWVRNKIMEKPVLATRGDSLAVDAAANAQRPDEEARSADEPSPQVETPA